MRIILIPIIFLITIVLCSCSSYLINSQAPVQGDKTTVSVYKAPISKGQTITLDGISLKMPEDYSYLQSENSLLLINDDETYFSIQCIRSTPPSQPNEQIEFINDLLKDEKKEVLDKGDISINNVRYYFIKYSDSNSFKANYYLYTDIYTVSIGYESKKDFTSKYAISFHEMLSSISIR